MNWTLSQLRAFCAVGDLGTMAAAADQLGYTAGAISQQIAALEKAVDEELFIRVGRTLVVTDAGIGLLNHARVILDAEARAVEAINRESDREVVTKVGIFGSAALYAIPKAIAILRKLDRPYSIRAFEVSLDEMPSRVTDGDLDIALSVDYPDVPTPPHHGLEIMKLHTEQFRLVLPPTAQFDTGTVDELLEYCNDSDWILPPSDQAFGKASLFALARIGVQPQVRHSVQDTAVSLALAESGVGITTATPLMLALRPTRAVLRDFPTSASRTIVALTRSSSSQRGSLKVVLSALQQAFHEVPSDLTAELEAQSLCA